MWLGNFAPRAASKASTSEMGMQAVPQEQQTKDDVRPEVTSGGLWLVGCVSEQTSQSL